jgi:signal-transduction protein with cAMP-binding, CBS, and nucleotidyltransferase domain
MDKTSSIDTFIKNSHLFNGLTEVELRHVNRSLKLQAFDKDEVIQRQGNRADALKLIVSGSIRLIMQDDEGISDTLSLAAGETFGEESLFPKDTFVYT